MPVLVQGEDAAAEAARFGGVPLVQATSSDVEDARRFGGLPINPATGRPDAPAADGTTDPNSIRITNPDGTPVTVLNPDGMPVPTAHLSAEPAQPFKSMYPADMPVFQRGRFTGLPGAGPLREPVTEGVVKAAGGLSQAASSLFTPPSQRGEPDRPLPIGTPEVPPTPLPDQTKAGVSQFIEGSFQALEPAAVAALLTNPVTAAIALGVASAASQAAQRAVKAVGGSDESARLAGNVAAAAAAAGGTDIFIRSARARAAKIAADARAVAAQARAFDAAHPEPAVPEEPIPVGRGSTSRVGANRLTEGTPQLPAAPEAEAPPPEPPPPTAPPRPAIDVAAAVRDLAAAEPNSPAALTAMTALQQAGLDLPTITARVQAEQFGGRPVESATPAPELSLREPTPPPVLDLPLREEVAPVAQRPVAPVPAATVAEAPPKTGLGLDLPGFGGAVVDNMYQRMLDRVQAGKPVWGMPEKPPLAEQVVQAAANRGLIQTLDDVKRFANMSIDEARAFFAPQTAPPAVAPAPLPPIGATEPQPPAAGPARVAQFPTRNDARMSTEQELLDVLRDASKPDIERRYAAEELEVRGINAEAALGYTELLTGKPAPPLPKGFRSTHGLPPRPSEAVAPTPPQPTPAQPPETTAPDVAAAAQFGGVPIEQPSPTPAPPAPAPAAPLRGATEKDVPLGTPQQVFQQFKRALTKAQNAKDWARVIAEADRFMAYYEAPGSPPFPDDWARWKVAREDAQIALQREAVDRSSRRPPTPQVPTEPGTKYVLPSFASTPGQRTAKAEPPAAELTAAEAEKLRRRQAYLEREIKADAERYHKLLAQKATETTRAPVLARLHANERDLAAVRARLGTAAAPAVEAAPPAAAPSREERPAGETAARPEPTAEAAKPPLTVQVYEALTREGWPQVKNAGEFRRVVAERLGVPEQTLSDDIDALNDGAEAALLDLFQPSDDLAETLVRARKAEALMPRAHRTLEKTKLQQFSTPLPIAVMAVHAADVRPGDIVLEPTAGTGNLLAPLKDRDDITMLAIEVAQRRAALLEAQGYHVQRGDYLGTKPSETPTVIISNPPWGKYTTGKYGRGVGLTFTPKDVAERFVAKMLRDLAPQGRLVAVMPTTMLDSPTFKKYLRDTVTVRAIIQSPPGAYDTRATSVESVLLVVDKIASDHAPLPAVVTTADWQAYAQAVQEIPHREHVPAPAERPARETARPAPERGAAGLPERQGSELAHPGRNPRLPAGRDTGVVAGQPGPQERGAEAAGPGVVEQPERATLDALSQSEGEFADVVNHATDEARAATGSRQFAPYVRRTAVTGVRHPKLIVEARQLAGVAYPPLTEKPGKAIQTALREKRVSVEQAEQALAAVQANRQGHHGYLAADNVGVGKSREIALTVLDLMEKAKAEGRELRLVLTTKSADNIADLIDSEFYYVATGRTKDGRDLLNVDAPKVVPQGLPFEVVKMAEWPDAKREGQEYKPLPRHPHAVYITDFYNLSAFRQALVDVSPHGIIGDEAHRFKNVEGAAAGGAWQNLHAEIIRGVPREQQVFAYFTATPAQNVNDYQYLYGLRLWPIDGFTQWARLATGGGDEKDAAALEHATEAGAFNIDRVAGNTGPDVIGGDSEDTAKSDKPKFAARSYADIFTSRLTPAEAEQIPREWKMLGRFSARDLWREGQEFIIHTATLKPEHVAKYDQFAELAQEIARTAYRFGLLDKSGKSSRFGVTGQLQFAAKRIQMQPALEEAITLARAKLAEGYQVVLSVINVSEMDPEKGNIAAAIEKINTRVKDTDPDDPDGGIVDLGEIPEALVAKAELLEQAKALGKFPDPIAIMEDAFGRDQIAFIVGDSGTQRRVAMKEFQEGKRPIAFLSSAGSTGINLDHRVLTDHQPARGRRVFIDVQFEWSATEAIQRYGRVGRAASVTQPVLMPLTFGNASEKKFLATIANRMSALGALSKGGAETTGAAGLEEFEITGPDAAQAARLAYNDLSQADKRKFAVVKSVFRSPNRSSEDPFEPAATAPASAGMKDVQLALLFVPLHTSNAFWQSFVEHRERVRETLGHGVTSRTEAYTGEILRTTNLGEAGKPLTLTEVKNQKGQRFGILSGLITQRMPKIREYLYTEEENGERRFSRKYVTFTAGDQIVSGLQIPWGKVKALADAFGAALTQEKLDTPAKVLAALKAGEIVGLAQPITGNVSQTLHWELRLRKDGKIAIDGAKMADRALLLHNGAAFAPVGNLWFTTEEKLPAFLERFPVAEATPAPRRGAASTEPEAMEIEEPRPGPRASGAPQPQRQPPSPGTQATPRRPARPFMERDVIPSLKAASEGVVDAHSNMRALWAPARVSESADVQATIMRPNLALRRQRDARARKTMRKLEVAWDRMPREQQLAFAMAVDEGRIDDLPESQRELARLLDAINTQKRREVMALGGKVGYIEHYFPREWVQPGKVREFVMRALYGKRPLQGRAGFKKARARDKETGEIFTFRELIDAGFEPVSYNPITAHLRKWMEMDKWIAARRILLEGKTNGVAKFVKVGDDHPDGWVRYPDSFGIVYGPPTIPVKEAYDAGLMEALHRFASQHGITMVRRLNLGGQRWGYHVRKGDRSEIHSKFAGPEGVLMHEIGHVLDHTHGLGEKIGLAQASERHEEINFAETPSKVLKELRALADLRLEKTSSKHFRQYVRRRGEVLANLVHAFLYAPDLAKQVAPNAYWALYNLAKDTPGLGGLLDIQKARSLRFGVNVTNAHIEGRVIKGQYYGPPDAVRLMENYLSPGLHGYILYDLYRHAGNLLNQVQLGLSAFHAVFTGLDAGLSQGALALEQASRGHLREAARLGAPGIAVSVGTAATVFGGPVGAAIGVPLAAAGILAPTIRGLVLGNTLMKRFYERDAQLRELVHEADIIVAAGGGVGWDKFWHGSAPEAFMRAIRNAKAEAGVGNYLGAALRGVAALLRAGPAILEAQIKPIMEWWVPRLKLAAFMDLARMELADLGPHPDPMEARRVLQSAWRSVDNRFGELIYDNLFWHAILKDAGMASVRALGFTLGTLDELIVGMIPAQLAQVGLLPSVGSGGGGWGKPPTRMRNTGEKPDPEGGPPIPIYERSRAPWLHHKFAYFLSAVWFGALFGALYQYLHTGLRPGEKEDGTTDRDKILMDLYFPRTGGVKRDGRPERAALPGYMKDFIVFNTHPLLGVENKQHPMLGLAADILRNEDYWGNAIHSEETPKLQQVAETLGYIAKDYRPISVKSFQERREQPGEKRGIGLVESLLGINVAPQSVTRSKVEEYLHDVSPPTHRTTEEAAHAEARRDLRGAIKAGDADAARAAIDAGNLSRRSLLAAARSARLTTLQRSFQATTLSHAITAYEIATPEERAELKPLLAEKWHRLFPEVAPGLKRATADRFKAAIALPVAQPAAAAAP